MSTSIFTVPLLLYCFSFPQLSSFDMLYILPLFYCLSSPPRMCALQELKFGVLFFCFVFAHCKTPCSSNTVGYIAVFLLVSVEWMNVTLYEIGNNHQPFSQMFSTQHTDGFFSHDNGALIIIKVNWKISFALPTFAVFPSLLVSIS